VRVDDVGVVSPRFQPHSYFVPHAIRTSFGLLSPSSTDLFLQNAAWAVLLEFLLL
jgi:hypothetical protein